MRLHRLVRARPRHAALGALVLAGTLCASPLAPAQPAPSPGAAGPATDGDAAAALRVDGAAAAGVTSRGGAGPAPTRASRARRRRPIRWRLVVTPRRYDVQAGAVVRVRGTLLPREGGRRVVVEAAAGSGRWRAVTAVRTRANGHFSARVRVGDLGVEPLRVRVAGGRGHRLPRAAAGTLVAFRPTLASRYDLYGGALACGGTLGYDTLGVANRTLPCGTRVTLRYRGRTLTVRVVDRGPYVGGREWDLTGATARRLGFDGVGVVWSTR